MQLLLKPVFVGWITFLTQLPSQLLFSILCGLLIGGVATDIGLFPNNSKLPIMLFGGTAFIVFPIVVYVVKKFNYRVTEYKFYDDRLEFQEGFLTNYKKTVQFEDVREVTLRKGVLQRVCGLGTVYLATQATGSAGSSNNSNVFFNIGFGNISASGISVRDIANPDEVYCKIQEIIGSNN